jgi:hypothetical protein
MTDEDKNQEVTDDEIYGLEKAVANDWEQLAKQTSDEIINRTQCLLGESSMSYVITFLGQEYILNVENQTIEIQDGEQFYNLFKIGIILHYMTHAQNKPLANKLISFRELWGGNEYYYAFNNRVLKPLTEFFSEKPELFQEAGQRLGGEKMEKGEYGFTIPALPRVPVTVLLWTGDDEVAASANVLFDATANEHMETEALVWLSIATVSELKALAIKSEIF